jgi:hypothetical protein
MWVSSERIYSRYLLDVTDLPMTSRSVGRVGCAAVPCRRRHLHGTLCIPSMSDKDVSTTYGPTVIVIGSAKWGNLTDSGGLIRPDDSIVSDK